jgi:CRP-like cAMP-binding protein
MFGRESDENARIQQLAKLDRFKGFSDAEIKLVVEAATYLTVPEGWAMMSENTPADKAYLIVDGEVSVRKRGSEIARLGPGDVIGEIAIVNHKLRSASVVSLTPLEVIHFTRESLEQLLDSVPAFGEALRATTDDRLGADQKNSGGGGG